MTALARPDLLFDPARRRTVVSEVAAPAYADELTSLFDRGYEHIEAKLSAVGADIERVKGAKG